MNKSDFITILATNNNITKAEAKRWLEAVLAAMEEGLYRLEEISIKGFGKFYTTVPKSNANPFNREIILPPRKQVRFKASKVLKEEVNG